MRIDQFFKNSLLFYIGVTALFWLGAHTLQAGTLAFWLGTGYGFSALFFFFGMTKGLFQPYRQGSLSRTKAVLWSLLALSKMGLVFALIALAYRFDRANFVWFLAGGAVLIIACLGAWLVHRWQLRRNHA